MSKIVKLEEFKQIIEDVEKTGETTAVLKISVIKDLVAIIEEAIEKNRTLIAQMYKLITTLKEKGLTNEEIEEILSLKK